MKPKPYVGVTGAVDGYEIKSIIKEFSEAGYTMDSSHLPMLGFLVCQGTLSNKQIKNRRYPKFSELKCLLEKTNNRVLTMIHYNSREMHSLSDQVFKLFDGIYEKGLCRALQLNIVWPDKEQVSLIKDKLPEMKIVFQLSSKAIEQKYNNPEVIARDLKRYGKSIDYVLIDPSAGRGFEFDLGRSFGIYKELNNRFPDLTIGFAGGFAGENVIRVVDELKEKIGNKDFCIDAEGGLRDKLTQEFGDDILNLKKVRKYLKEASSVLK